MNNDIQTRGNPLKMSYEHVEKEEGGYRLKRSVLIETSLKGIYYDGWLLSINDNKVIMNADFFWDGATYVHDGFKDWRGIPLNWQATCLHDILIEEKRIAYTYGRPFPLSDKTIDKLFCE